MAITAEEKYLLNTKMGSVAAKVQLGTLIETAETISPADASVVLADLSAGIAPSHVVKYGGKFTTLGGDATETITVSGLASTDIVHVTVQTAGGTPRSIVAAIPTTNTITVTLSGDPSTDHILGYVCWRAAV